MPLPYMPYPMFVTLRKHMPPKQEKGLSPLSSVSVHTQKKRQHYKKNEWIVCQWPGNVL